MVRKPAPMVPALPSERPVNMTYEYDWLANMTEWTADANAFHERSLGTNIINGQEAGGYLAGERPAAVSKLGGSSGVPMGHVVAGRLG